MSNFIGNTDFIRLLRIEIEAAKIGDGEALPHILLKGPAGTGKTTLAEAIAREFGTVPLALTAGTAKKAEDLRRLFLRMPEDGYDKEGRIVGKIQPQIVFVDEIHQLPLLAQENLGIAMQDWKLPVRVNNQDVFEWVPRFTLIGATTLPGKLSKPFLDRFKIQSEFETYAHDEALEVTELHANTKGLRLGEGVAEAIAKRSRGVPRLVVRYLERIHSAAKVAHIHDPNTPANLLSIELSELMFKQFLKVDDRGLTKTDIKILLQLHKQSDPIGLDMLATIANEDKGTVQGSIEPYLLHEGLLARTKRGRVLTEEGRRYLVESGYIEDEPQLGRASRLMGEPHQ